MDSGEDAWMSSPDMCVCSVTEHDTIPDAPFFLITSTPEGKHVVHATWPTSLPPITVSQDADALSKFLFPLLHHTAPFRLYAHINTTGAPSAYRLKTVKREVDAAVLNGARMVKEIELLDALCSLRRELYYAPQLQPHQAPHPDIVESMVVDVDAAFASPLNPDPPYAPPCEGFIRPLRPAQQHALKWMFDMERDSARTLVLDPRVPISDTVAVDLLTHTLVCARTPALPSSETVDINVGVLTGARGAGKTAVALALALSSDPPRGPPAPLTPYEALHLTPCPATTLVIVPRHLLPCWKLELKACCPNAAALFLSNVREARVTAAQVMAARLIVTTDHVVESIALARAEETPIRYFNTPGSIVPLHAFKWRRVVVDEALRKNALAHTRLHTDWWWCLCAEAEKMHPYKLLQKLEFATLVDSDRWAGSLQARTQFVTRYVHALTNPEREVDAWSDMVVWVDLRPDEYMRYEAAKSEGWSDERLLKLCCGAPQDQPGGFVQPQSLSTISQLVSVIHQSTTRTLKEMNQEDMQVLEAALAENHHFSHFQQVVQELHREQQQQQCPVCVEDACTLITSCGHMYCWTCMFRTFRGASASSCPYCRKLLSASDVYQIAQTGQEATGQKCVALISMLSELMSSTSDRVVVYVAWYSLAQQLASVLDKAGISVRAMSGRGVESTLKAFESGGVRVLVLPYDYGEGLTLVCANHVVIYHATSQKNSDIALASVNRTGQTKPVRVHRFIAKATLEETFTQ